MRVGHITILGVEYPLVYSAAAQMGMEEKGVSIKSASTVRDTMICLHEMMRAGAAWMRLNHEQSPEVPTFEDLAAAVSFEDSAEIRVAMLETFTGKRGVVAQPGKKTKPGPSGK